MRLLGALLGLMFIVGAIITSPTSGGSPPPW
jgi:hypothetical protein